MTAAAPSIDDVLGMAWRNRLTEREWREQFERDLHMSAIHEAAHVIVARSFGADASAYVVPTFTTNPMEDKFFVGKTFLSVLDARARMVVCMAGTVAEAYEDNDGVDGLSLMVWLEDGVVDMSDTDAAGAFGYAVKDLDDCVALVRKLWPQIIEEAAPLAQQALKMLSDWKSGGAL